MSDGVTVTYPPDWNAPARPKQPDACVRLVELPEDFRDFADDWAGGDIDLWRRIANNQGWCPYEGPFRGGDYVERLPLYTGAGMDLALRYLAKCLDMLPYHGALWSERPDGWQLRVNHSMGWDVFSFHPSRTDKDDPEGDGHYTVPQLVDIDKADPRRAVLALRLCLLRAVEDL